MWLDRVRNEIWVTKDGEAEGGDRVHAYNMITGTLHILFGAVSVVATYD